MDAYWNLGGVLPRGSAHNRPPQVSAVIAFAFGEGSYANVSQCTTSANARLGGVGMSAA